MWWWLGGVVVRWYTNKTLGAAPQRPPASWLAAPPQDPLQSWVRQASNSYFLQFWCQVSNSCCCIFCAAGVEFVFLASLDVPGVKFVIYTNNILVIH
jgi:hypothetical protein